MEEILHPKCTKTYPKPARYIVNDKINYRRFHSAQFCPLTWPLSITSHHHLSLITFICHRYWEGGHTRPIYNWWRGPSFRVPFSGKKSTTFTANKSCHLRLPEWSEPLLLDTRNLWRYSIFVFHQHSKRDTVFLIKIAIPRSRPKNHVWLLIHLYKPTMPRPNLGLMIPGTRGLHVVYVCLSKRNSISHPSVVESKITLEKNWRATSVVSQKHKNLRWFLRFSCMEIPCHSQK